MSIMGQLGNLEAAGLVRVAQVEPDLEYLFRHALVQEAAYASLLENDRQQLHLSVGETIEQLYPDRLDEFAAVLARHFEKAGDDEHALVYFIRAADAALAAYANKEAEMHFRRALELSCPQCEHAQLLAGLGETLYRQTRFEEAIDAWWKGIELFKQESDIDSVARLYSRIARVTWHMGDIPGSSQICEAGLQVVKGAPESGDIAMLLHEAGRSYYFSGISQKALPLCKKALEMAEQFGAVEVQADALATYAVLPDIKPEESLEALQKAVEIAKKHGLLAIAGRAYHNLGAMTSTYSNDLPLARHYYWKAAEMGRQRGVIIEELSSLEVAAGIDLTMGKLSEVEETLEHIHTLLQSLPNPAPTKLQVSDLQIGLMWMRGQWKEAVQLAETGYHETRQSGNLQMQFAFAANFIAAMLELHRYGEIDDLTEVETTLEEVIEVAESWLNAKSWPYGQMAILRTRQGRFEEAHQLLSKAEQLAKKQSSHWDKNTIGEPLAELAHREGRYDEALEIYQSVASFYKKTDNRWSQARSLMDWAEACTDKGDPADLEQARNLLREALIILDEMGAHRHKRLVEERLQILRDKIYARAVTYQRDAQELARAAQVQGSFLPEQVPQLPGWQISVTLHPARQTSGDFYDFIPLPGGRLGLIVADVADKGAAAALFMATSQSLIRTYAGEFLDTPEQALAATSRRMLADTHAGLFVTVFYGVLDPESGRLAYCNAGHTPAIFLPQQGKFQALSRTGPPLGVFEEAHWERGEIQIEAGTSLVLYTDGVTEAQNRDDEFFGEKGLLVALKHHRQGSAEEIHTALLSEVHQFVGSTPQFDDITLMVLQRQE